MVGNFFSLIPLILCFLRGPDRSDEYDADVSSLAAVVPPLRFMIVYSTPWFMLFGRIAPNDYANVNAIRVRGEI